MDQKTDKRCICGHSENMHYGGCGPKFRCMKTITRHHNGDVKCTCQEFRPEKIEKDLDLVNV